MAAILDPATFVHEFLARIGSRLDHVPDPFDCNSLGADTNGTLPARLRGKLVQLRESENEITKRYTSERGSLTQRFVSRGGHTGYFSERRTLDRNEERDRSGAQERWFCGLSAEERAAFDAHCLRLAGTSLPSSILRDVPRCLHGALARLVLEAAALVRGYSADRVEIEESLRARDLAIPSVVPALLNRVVADEKYALSSLVGRWLRELTPDQEAALNGGTTSAMPDREPPKPETSMPRKKRMSVKKANEIALRKAHELRKGFFALSRRQQAKLIGCSFSTWERTDFYEMAQSKRPIGKQEALSSPKAVSLTDSMQAVTGEGGREEVLERLVAEQKGEGEPSPLDDRRQKVHFRKRL